MINAEQVQKQEGRDKTPAEKSAELVSRVEGRLLGTDPLSRYKETPGAKDVEQDLDNKITGLARAEGALREIIAKTGGYQDLGMADKVKFAEALDKAKFYTTHAFAEPADLSQVQRDWETAVDNFKNKATGSVERTRAVLSGEINAEGIQKLAQETIPSHEAQALQDYLAKTPDLTPQDKDQLLKKLAARIEELRTAEGKLTELAPQKQLPAQERDAHLQTYKAAAENYKKSQQSLRNFLKQIENYGPK